MEDATAAVSEAVMRHVEVSGSEALLDVSRQNGRIVGTVACVLGPKAEAFAMFVQQWLNENGGELD